MSAHDSPLGLTVSCQNCAAPLRLLEGASPVCVTCGSDTPVPRELSPKVTKILYELKNLRGSRQHLSAGLYRPALRYQGLYLPKVLGTYGLMLVVFLGLRFGVGHQSNLVTWLGLLSLGGSALTLLVFAKNLARFKQVPTFVRALPPMAPGQPVRCRCCGFDLPNEGIVRRCSSCGSESMVMGERYEARKEQLLESLDQYLESLADNIFARVEAAEVQAESASRTMLMMAVLVIPAIVIGLSWMLGGMTSTLWAVFGAALAYGAFKTHQIVKVQMPPMKMLEDLEESDEVLYSHAFFVVKRIHFVHPEKAYVELASDESTMALELTETDGESPTAHRIVAHEIDGHLPSTITAQYVPDFSRGHWGFEVVTPIA